MFNARSRLSPGPGALHIVSVAVLLTLGLGCASVPLAPLAGADSSWVDGFGHPAVAPAGVDVGIHTLSERSESLMAGDRLTFELRTTRDGVSKLRYLVFEVTGVEESGGAPIVVQYEVSVDGAVVTRTSALHRVRVDLSDESGALIGTSSLSIAGGLARSQMAACAAAARLAEDLRAVGLEFDPHGFAELGDQERVDRDASTMRDAERGLFVLMGLAQSDNLLSELLWEVVERPSVWSLITSLGATTEVEPGYERAQRLEGLQTGAGPEGPFYSLPLVVSVNGSDALRMKLLVTEPVAPWNLISGIVAFEGRHPTKDLTISARMIGAR